MDSISWMAPPGAAQPAGIQSTAGAVPVMNEKGEVSMKKVKVQRYISGKRPEYAPVSSDDEIDETEDFTKPRAAVSYSSKSLTESEMQDPRLRRLLNAQQHDRPTEKVSQRFMHQSEVFEVSDEEDKDEQVTERRDNVRPARLAESDDESEEEVDEEQLALRRLKIREAAIQKTQDEPEVLGKEDEGSEESSEESSEYTEESESEEEGPRLKPVFVRKKDRVTIHQKEVQYAKQKQLEVESRKRGEERRRETLRIIEHENRKAQIEKMSQEGSEGNFAKIEDINTDDEADDAEYEAWKLRELRRLKRDKDEREAIEREKEEVDRLRNMTEEERRLELRSNPKVITNKSVKGKYKFLQKYFHRGAFFLNEDDTVYKRDFSGATLEDHFDKTILPKVMQVKNFGRSGRTKYTHLVDQDTTSFDSPWAADTQMNHKFSNSNAGGMKQFFDKPTNKKKFTSSSNYSSNRK